jgi:hypothetical protein
MPVRQDINGFMIKNCLLVGIFFLAFSVQSCKNREFSIPPKMHELKKKADIGEDKKNTGNYLAKNMILHNGNRYTISNYKITTIRIENKIIFAKLDLSDPAPEDYVYWYDHQKLSKEFGVKISGLKYQ